MNFLSRVPSYEYNLITVCCSFIQYLLAVRAETNELAGLMNINIVAGISFQFAKMVSVFELSCLRALVNTG